MSVKRGTALILGIMLLLFSGVSSGQERPALPANYRTYFSLGYAGGNTFGIGTRYQLGPTWDLTGQFAFGSAAGVSASAWSLGVVYHFTPTPAFDPYLSVGVARLSITIPGIGTGTLFGGGGGLGVNAPLATNVVGNAEIGLVFAAGASAVTYNLGVKYFVSEQAAIKAGFGGLSGASTWVVGIDYHFPPSQ